MWFWYFGTPHMTGMLSLLWIILYRLIDFFFHTDFTNPMVRVFMCLMKWLSHDLVAIIGFASLTNVFNLWTNHMVCINCVWLWFYFKFTKNFFSQLLPLKFLCLLNAILHSLLANEIELFMQTWYDFYFLTRVFLLFCVFVFCDYHLSF